MKRLTVGTGCLAVVFAMVSCGGKKNGCVKGSSEESAEDTVAVVLPQNPLPMKLGDPFLLHASDGRYYMYGTSLADGFEAFVSDDLAEWKPCGQVYKGGDEGQWNVDCFWAPEV